MAKSSNSRRRRGSQAQTTRRGRQILTEAQQRLAEQRRELNRQRKEAKREALRTKRSLASLLRKLGLYKPKTPRITNKTIRSSGALKRKLRFYKEIPREIIRRERPKPPPQPRKAAPQVDYIRAIVTEVANLTHPEISKYRDRRGISISRDDWIEGVVKIARRDPARFLDLVGTVQNKRQAWEGARSFRHTTWAEWQAELGWEELNEFFELYYYHTV